MPGDGNAMGSGVGGRWGGDEKQEWEGWSMSGRVMGRVSLGVGELRRAEWKVDLK